MTIEVEQEADDRWIAEVPSVLGALAYGQTSQEAVSRVETLVLRILADRLEHGELSAFSNPIFATPGKWN